MGKLAKAKRSIIRNGGTFLMPRTKWSLERIFVALSSVVRQQILIMASSRPNRRISCKELLDSIEVQKATLSNHLITMESTGLIEKRRCGIFLTIEVTDLGMAAARAIKDISKWAG